MTYKLQRIGTVLMWILISLLWGLQIETRIAVNNSHREHEMLMKNQDTIKQYLKPALLCLPLLP